MFASVPTQLSKTASLAPLTARNVATTTHTHHILLLLLLSYMSYLTHAQPCEGMSWWFKLQGY